MIWQNRYLPLDKINILFDKNSQNQYPLSFLHTVYILPYGWFTLILELAFRIQPRFIGLGHNVTLHGTRHCQVDWSYCGKCFIPFMCCRDLIMKLTKYTVHGRYLRRYQASRSYCLWNKIDICWIYCNINQYILTTNFIVILQIHWSLTITKSYLGKDYVTSSIY